MANRDPNAPGLLNEHDTKTLRTLLNIIIYSAIKLEIPITEAWKGGHYRSKGRFSSLAEEAADAVESGGLNGTKALSWECRREVLRSIFEKVPEEDDVYDRVYIHAKEVAKWIRGPVSEGTNRNYDPMNEMGDAIELLIKQPMLSKWKDMVYKSKSRAKGTCSSGEEGMLPGAWAIDMMTEGGEQVLYDEVGKKAVSVFFFGAGFYGADPGARVDLLVLPFKDYYFVDTGPRGVEHWALLGEVKIPEP
eukprot:CAMPEP_0182478296 /NCGR_PEP_ID=MMETSP1319-20130603/32277_1 /TAXON_ID=172717 /ORGANISM="Bolidomonas pacifica, Strain RCC208" /LENGTH=247 /DNA_ID=CAMNT_0024679619 /DNA_START=15 /DNA_END=754 /DNA_ORIENTATION=+